MLGPALFKSTPIVFSKKYTVKNCGHIFKTGKFEAALRILLKEKVITRSGIIEPRRPSKRELLLAHTPAWVKKILSGKLSPEEQARAELETSKEVIEAHLMNTGGTILAAEIAMRTGLGINCGGGGHHACAGHGEGFCLLNDIAVAVNKLRKDAKVKRALIIDLDAHQGNGTAEIFKKDKAVFTFSIHQSGLYPAAKERGSLDLELPAGAGDAAYLKLLKTELPQAFRRARPDLVIYNAGVDVYERDLLGGLKLTMKGVGRRDEFVFEECFKRKAPVAVVLSGGYAEEVSDTARLHANTIKTALGKFREYNPARPGRRERRGRFLPYRGKRHENTCR
jgi:acetoin utilization deacetylase AcuC-like enzyme